MKPSALKSGARVRRITGGSVWTFLRIERDGVGRASLAVLQSDTCRGLNGPGDAGLAVVTVAELARGYVRCNFELTGRG